MSKRTQGTDRRARLAQMRRQEQAVQRRRTLLVAAVTLVVVVALVAAVVTVIVRYQRENDLAALGEPAADADCGDVVTEPATGAGTHTEEPVEYDSVPPMFGPHRTAPEFPSASFYTPEEAPEVEGLVHNLEHGYTLLWYSPDLGEEQVQTIERITVLARDEPATGGKFIAAPWDVSRGKLPADAPVALTHWGAQEGAKQYCGAVSGPVVQDFIEAYPANDAPEPNAQ